MGLGTRYATLPVKDCVTRHQVDDIQLPRGQQHSAELRLSPINHEADDTVVTGTALATALQVGQQRGADTTATARVVTRAGAAAQLEFVRNTATGRRGNGDHAQDGTALTTAHHHHHMVRVEVR